MYSYYTIYGIGLAVSVISIGLWIPIISAQIKQFSGRTMNNRIKTALLIFAITSMVSNFVPIWFDIYRIIHPSSPSNVYYAYITSSYLYRILSAIMFFIIYKF